MSKGKSKFVPLPFWNPLESINSIFFGTQAQLVAPAGTFPTIYNDFPFDPPSPLSYFYGADACMNHTNFEVFIAKLEGDYHDKILIKLFGSNPDLSTYQTMPGYSVIWLLKAFIDEIAYCYQKDCLDWTYDLYVRDDVNDIGIEPSNAPQLWVSPDIWVRNSADGFVNQSSESINESAQDKTAYVYIKVWNTGPLPSLTDVNNIKAYWAKASSGLSLPEPWDGFIMPGCTHKFGEQVGELKLRSVNEDFIDFTQMPNVIIKDYNIYEFEWNIPDPDKITACFPNQPQEKHNFCILAVMDDGNSLNLTGSLSSIISNNNNVAMRNVTIFSDGFFINQPQIGCVFISNYTEQVINDINLEINFPPATNNNTLLNKAEVKVYFKDGLEGQLNALQTAGLILNNQEEKYLVNNNTATINGIYLAAKTNKRICIQISPTNVDNQDYAIDLVQKRGNTIIGGERFEIVLKGPGGLLERPLDSPIDIKNENRKILFYPNPSSGIINVISVASQISNIWIKDSQGSILLNYQDIDNNEFQIDVSSLIKGHYVAEILLSSGEIIHKSFQIF